MKNRGVGASLHPAKDAAREAARASLPPMPTGGGSAPQPIPPAGRAMPAVEPAPAGARVGEWLLTQDPASGALIARHELTGLVRELAALPGANNEGS